MEGMLRDAFNMHSHGLQSIPPKIIVSNDCDIGGNAFTKTGRSVPDEEPNGEAAKFYKNTEDVNKDEGEAQSRNKPIKILWYFRLIPRLQRLFMSAKTAESMRWHHNQRTDDGLLRHPADSLAWKSFDSKFPSFTSDPQNVRLGLASDELNPFKIMSTLYSIWPVVFVPYNLPPWICTK
ncbi:hypothetical protein J1N35_043709 [Gossypium stocksii]|uniref:Uncharacterized protein n=1 Tax=Gossypium stocksii TaxID=47602 RepID=A0A9D3ZFB7_9ROSI|nr:hypothetical protein J1N35_043709 [Gossypium stocksii]